MDPVSHSVLSFIDLSVTRADAATYSVLIELKATSTLQNAAKRLQNKFNSSHKELPKIYLPPTEQF